MKKQNGSAHMVVVIVLVLALITALGWIFWQNFVHKEPVKTEVETVVREDEETGKNNSKPVDEYEHYFWVNSGQNQGKIIAKPSDVDKYVPKIGSELKAYMKSKAGKTIQRPDGTDSRGNITYESVVHKFEIWEAYGNYMVGSSSEFSGLGGGYVWLGLGDDKKTIKRLGGGQSGKSCQELNEMGIPDIFRQDCYATDDAETTTPYDVWSKNS